MSTDVENALLNVIEQFGNGTREQAIEFLENLKEDGRYQKDVY